eukprot:COSAG05_NODE_1041_length_6067_cov_116.470845_5_plen_416_part_00
MCWHTVPAAYLCLDRTDLPRRKRPPRAQAALVRTVRSRLHPVADPFVWRCRAGLADKSQPASMRSSSQGQRRGRSRPAASRWDDDGDLEGGISWGGGTAGKGRHRRGSDGGDDDGASDGCCHSLKTFLRKQIGWVVVVLLLTVWYSEHVTLRNDILQMQLELGQLQGDYTKASLTAAGTATTLRSLKHNVEEYDGGHPAYTGPPATEGLPDLAGKHGEHVYDHDTTHQVFDAHQEAHAQEHTPPTPPLPPPPPPPPTPSVPAPPPPPRNAAAAGTCVSWRQTGGCTADGPREPDADKSCDTEIWKVWSGFCECSWGNHMTVGGNCRHFKFTCNEACAGGPDWVAPAPPPPPPEVNRNSLMFVLFCCSCQNLTLHLIFFAASVALTTFRRKGARIVSSKGDSMHELVPASRLVACL